MIIQNIKSPSDIKGLDLKQLKTLAQEIRDTIIKRVSINGGHLASNLGVVELAIALHYVFDSPKDKIVWDVGHQSYPHKLLTGRYNRFKTLRKFKGISGFPSIKENHHDAFGTGHSSTSISAALGILEARNVKKTPYPEKVIAVIGDGALTSGLAFEGLNQAGYLNKDLVVVLNNNDMSISPSIGALSVYLNKTVNGVFYKKEPESLSLSNKKYQIIKEESKRSFSPGEFFEDLGFHYIKAFDGHNINLLIKNLKKAQKSGKPTLIHTITKKGKGYKFSENDPCVFHGISSFSITTGCQKKTKMGPASFSSVFGNTLTEIASKNKKVIAITAAMKEGTGLSKFAEKFPKRFYDVGIAESHAVTFAAGLSSQGAKPVVAIYSTFLQRSYDQIVHDVCLQNLPVVFAIDRAGLVGEDGATHHGIFDISFLQNIPNLSIISPKDTEEMKKMLHFAVNFNGPIAIRYPRGSCRDTGENKKQKIETGKSELLLKGKDVAIIGIGNTVGISLEAAETLKKKGIKASVLNARWIKPIDEKMIISLAKKTKKIVTVEENILKGGFGSTVLDVLNRNGLSKTKLKMVGIDDKFVEHGAVEVLREKYGISASGICKAVMEL